MTVQSLTNLHVYNHSISKFLGMVKNYIKYHNTIDRKDSIYNLSLIYILLPRSFKVEYAFPLFFFCKMSFEGIRVAQNIYNMNYTRSLYIFFRVCCDATLSSISCVYGSYNLLSLLKFHIVPCQLGRRRINHHFIAL